MCDIRPIYMHLLRVHVVMMRSCVARVHAHTHLLHVLLPVLGSFIRTSLSPQVTLSLSLHACRARDVDVATDRHARYHLSDGEA